MLEQGPRVWHLVEAAKAMKGNKLQMHSSIAAGFMQRANCTLSGGCITDRLEFTLFDSPAFCTLQSLVPEKARLEIRGQHGFREVPTEALSAGDILVVLPGDKFPVDGVVVSGNSSCNEAALTGEPMPAIKSAGALTMHWDNVNA